jgi:hypothetical protein
VWAWGRRWRYGRHRRLAVFLSALEVRVTTSVEHLPGHLAEFTLSLAIGLALFDVSFACGLRRAETQPARIARPAHLSDKI